MPSLHNRVNRRELKERMLGDKTPRTTVSFYLYTPIEDPAALRDRWYAALRAMGVLGRIYVAQEGVNAQVSVPETEFPPFRDFLYAEPGFDGLRLNVAVDERAASFFVLTVKVKRKIVADGLEETDFDMRNRGRYVDARGFNELTDDPATVVIDMRNHYEYEVGHFRDAREVPSDTFREQLPMAVEMLSEDKDRNIIMYCTGGIRCEKASAWMLHNGFRNVFHLEGGIINYVRQVREQGLENRFLGKNFVFDERLGERISGDVLANCHQCGTPSDDHVNCANEGCHLLFIQCPACREAFRQCCSDDCRSMMEMPAEARRQLRKGRTRPRNVFHKSKERVEERFPSKGGA